MFLTLTVSVPGLRPPECPTNIDCQSASKLQVRVFYCALYVVAIGVGGVKPCASTLGGKKKLLIFHEIIEYPHSLSVQRKLL